MSKGFVFWCRLSESFARRALIVCGICAGLCACGGGSDGIDENGQCRSEGKVQAASVCGETKTPTPPAPINCQADRTCL